MFDYFDGKTDRAQAVSALKFNTHKYVRKQLTWFRRDADYRWFHPDDWDGIRSYLEQNGIRL
jgi:tRNA dimethylallyltransferase